MSRSLRTKIVVALSLSGLLGAFGCRSRAPSSQEQPLGSLAASAGVASPSRAPRDAVVRPISPMRGGGVVVAEVDRRRLAVVADEEESALQLVDLDTHAVSATIPLDGMPGQMLLAPDGTLFVAIRGAARVVALRFVEGGKTRVIGSHSTADEPFGLALTPDNATLLVTTIVDPGVQALRAKDLTPEFAAELPRDPRSIAVSNDGARAFVSHAVGSAVSVVELTGASPGTTRKVNLDATERRRDFGLALVTKMPLPPSKRGSMARAPVVRITMKRSATQGFGLAMIGEHVHVPETLVMTSDNEGPPTGYGSVEQSTLSTHVPFVARIGVSDEKVDNATFSGPADRQCFERKTECILPRAVTDDGKKMYVACLDSDEVLIVDPEQDAEHAPACKKTADGRTLLHVASPSALAIDGERASAVVFSTFTRKLSVVALDGTPAAAGEGSEVALPRGAALPELVTLGCTLFHRSGDPRIAKNGRACASCHVEGRDDGLVWPTPMGKRQTPMLAGRVEGTAPYGWNGEHPSLVVHIKSTVKNLEGTGVQDRELEALSAYVASMHAPSKHRATSDAIARGQTIFRSSETGCSSCHVEDTHFTDLGTHQFPVAQRGRPAFDTPSLAFVGQSAPYFHDGRFATLEELIDGCDRPDTQMGTTKHLAPDDRRALVAYLRSL